MIKYFDGFQCANPTPEDERWHTGARVELKKRLDVQVFDFNYSLGHSTSFEAWNAAGLVMGSIHDMQEYDLLTLVEVAKYQAQVRTAFAEAHPADLALFDQIWMWDPLQ